jgi:hypothetical protein
MFRAPPTVTPFDQPAPVALTPSLVVLMTSQMPTYRHIPAVVRSQLAEYYGQVVQRFVTVQAWETLYALLSFAKLVLASPVRSGKVHKREAIAGIRKRLTLFSEGKYNVIWDSIKPQATTDRKLRSATKSEEKLHSMVEGLRGT